MNKQKCFICELGEHIADLKEFEIDDDEYDYAHKDCWEDYITKNGDLKP